LMFYFAVTMMLMPMPRYMPRQLYAGAAAADVILALHTPFSDATPIRYTRYDARRRHFAAERRCYCCYADDADADSASRRH